MPSNIVLRKIYEFKLYILITILLILLETILVSSSAILIAPLVDHFNNSQSDQLSKITIFLSNIGIPNKINIIVIIFLIVFTFSYLFKIFTHYFSLKFKFLFLIELNKIFYNSILNANWNFIKNQKSGNLINLIRQEIEKIGNIFMSVSRFFSDSLQIIFLLFSAFFIDFLIAGSTILILLIALIPFIFFKKLSQKYGRVSFKAGSFLSENLNNFIKNTKIIITNNLGPYFLKNYIKEYKIYSRSQIISQTLINGLPQMVYPMGIFVLISIILLFINQSDSITDITVIFFIFYRIIPLLTSIISNYNTLNNVIPVVSELQKIYEKSESNKTKNDGLNFADLKNEIKFEKVFYKHDDEDEYFFNNLNFKIKKDSIFGIFGPSGSGKSTLIDILTGNLIIDSGMIFFDDTKISDLNLKHFRDKISIIGQDVPIFNDTILNNLFISNHEINDTFVQEILNITGVNQFTSTFEKKYFSNIGSGGIMISGGQKQRIALARALIRKPKILILDEFVSALDEKTQEHFLEMIIKIKDKTTVIMITHNLNHKKICNDYLELKNGVLVN